MKLSDKSQTLLERYLMAVERRLPLQGRKDIIKEIRSNLLDTLEDHYSPEEIVSESMLEEELRKLGSPQSVVRGYRQADTLIGAQYNTLFRLVVTVLTPIIVTAIILAGVLSFILSGGENPLLTLWELISDAFSVAVSFIGTCALVLMLLTRFFPQVNQNKSLDFLDEENKNWSINDLPELVKEPEKVTLWEPIVGIFFGIMWILFFTFFFDELAGLWWFVDGQWQMMPIFTQTFIAYIPWIAINIGLDLCLNSLLLYQRRRSLFSRVFEIGIKISELTLSVALLKAGALLTFDADLALQKGIPVEGIQTIIQGDYVHWFLVFLVVVLSIDLLGKITGEVKILLQENK